jgi:hypothetical protein
MFRLNHIVFALLVMALSAGCNDQTTNVSCQVSADCPLPLVCLGAAMAAGAEPARAGRCAQECRVDSDCPDGLCIDDVCHSPDRSCRINQDCVPFGRSCDPASRRCVAPCGIDRSCPSATICVGSICQPVNEPMDTGIIAPRLDAGRQTMDARRPMVDSRVVRDARPRPADAGMSVLDQSMSLPPDMALNRGVGQYGDSCRCGADCETGLCVPNPYKQFAGECSRTCDAGNRCPGIDRCIDVSVPPVSPNCPPAGLGYEVGQLISVCAVNETGLPCSTGQECVIDGICLTPPNPVAGQIRVQPACAARCDGDQGCPVGFRCSAVAINGGAMANVCSPVAQLHSCPDGSNESCGGVCPVQPGDDEVNISHCIVFGPGQPGYCSCSCQTSAQCPQGFACSRNIIDTGDAQRPGICLPISGYTCPMGHDSCLSAGCVGQLEVELFSRCTAPCVSPNDCPTGYRCIQIADEDGTFCVADP